MDDVTERFSGALAAQGFLIENILAMLLVRERDPIGDCQAIAEECIRQFTLLHATPAAPMDVEAIERVTEHGARRLRSIFDRVERRLSQ